MDKGKSTVTLHDIDNEIVREQYYVFPGTTVTVCCLTLRNGFHVTGDGACIDPNMFDEEKGRAIALCDAKNKIWPLLAYKLKDKTNDEQKVVLTVEEAKILETFCWGCASLLSTEEEAVHDKLVKRIEQAEKENE